MKNILIFLFPIYLFAQTDADRTIEYLTSDTWNISYNITPEGERIEESDQEKIRSSWVRFNKDGRFEMPGGIAGKTVGKWSFDSETNSIHFIDGRTKYRAIVDEISEMNLLLNYVDHGGYKIGLIHYVFIPKPKSEEEVRNILLSGRWLVIKQFFDAIEDQTPTEDIENSWFEFYEDMTYKRSEVFGEETRIHEGSWFIDDEMRLNLDGNEMMIYQVSGDNSNLVLTSNADGIRIINCRKSK